MKRHSRRSGGRILIDALAIHGVDTVVRVPGGSCLAARGALGALDALHDAIDPERITTRATLSGPRGGGSAC